jgi:hypothetical protein
MATAPADPSPYKVVVPGQTVILQINNEQYVTCQAKASGKFLVVQEKHRCSDAAS